MEVGVREIVALLVLLTLAGVAAGLLLRYRRSQYGRIKSRIRYRFNSEENGSQDDREYGSELPSGGARVVGYRDPDDIKTVHKRIREQAEASRPKLSGFRAKPEQTSLKLEEDSEPEIPMLLDPAGMDPELPPLDERHEDEEKGFAGDQAKVIAETTSAHEEVDPLFMDSATPELRVDPNERPRNLKMGHDDAIQGKSVSEETDSAAERDSELPLEVLVINLMAPRGTMLAGENIDAALASNGLVFGDMEIYHYDERMEKARVRFSVANIVNPGTFPNNSLNAFSSPGLCFFMTLSEAGSNLASFDKMLAISEDVAGQLDVKLHDEQRSVMTRQTIEHYRNRIRDFERRRMLR